MVSEVTDSVGERTIVAETEAISVGVAETDASGCIVAEREAEDVGDRRIVCRHVTAPFDSSLSPQSFTARTRHSYRCRGNGTNVAYNSFVSPATTEVPVIKSTTSYRYITPSPEVSHRQVASCGHSGAASFCITCCCCKRYVPTQIPPIIMASGSSIRANCRLLFIVILRISDIRYVRFAL